MRVLKDVGHPGFMYPTDKPLCLILHFHLFFYVNFVIVMDWVVVPPVLER